MKYKIAGIVAAVLVVVLILGFVGVRTILHGMFGKFEIDMVRTAVAHYDYYEADYPRREIHFDSDGNSLLGYIYGEENTKALAVFGHGIWSGPEDYLVLITYLVDKGYRVFTFNNTAYNGSEGESALGLPRSALDSDAALTYIESDPELSQLPKVLIGHSWGGYAVTASLNFDHDIKAVCALSGFNDPVEVTVDMGRGTTGVFSYLLRPYYWLSIYMDFGKNTSLRAVDGINKFGGPVLIVHGVEDEAIGYDFGAIIAHRDEITNPNAEYLTLDKPEMSDHNAYFNDEVAKDYKKTFLPEWEELSKQYKGEVPEDVAAEFFGKIDLETANRPNTELFDQIVAFFDEAIN